MAQVIQGMMRGEPAHITEPKHLLLLWIHESMRVFQDRLVNSEDRNWFRFLLEEKLEQHFHMEYTEVMTNDRLIFADFLDPAAEKRAYIMMEDEAKLAKTVGDLLEEYNQVCWRDKLSECSAVRV